MEESDNEEGQVRRPTPVRAVMDPVEAEEEEKGRVEVRRFLDPVKGQEWFARISGRSISGVVPLRTIPLIDVCFFKSEDPGTPVRRILCQGESMEHLDDDGLLRLLRASSSHAPPAPGPPTPDSQGRRGGQRRKP